jgi:hypothetical protein
MNVRVEDVFATWLGGSMLLLVYGGIVWMLVDVARRPDWQFTATGRSPATAVGLTSRSASTIGRRRHRARSTRGTSDGEHRRNWILEGRGG